MKWGHARHAASLPHTDTEGPAFFRSRRSAAMSGLAPITSQTLKGDGPGLLILSPAMQRDAFQMDRDRAALRRDMQAVNRVEAEARKATTAALAKGI